MMHTMIVKELKKNQRNEYRKSYYRGGKDFVMRKEQRKGFLSGLCYF